MAQKNIWKDVDSGDLTGYTLIVPSVAVGNVGQFASDLLISSLNMKKISSVYSKALIPILGYDPYDLNSNNLSSCCEIYKSDVKKIIILQLRAPLVYKYARMFLEDIIYKYKSDGIRDVIVLTSSYAHEKKHISTSPFRYVASDSCIFKDKLKSMKWIEHEAVDSELKIYGGGFAPLLYSICNEKSLACLILYKYCSEGDNIPDAYDMVQQLTNILPLFNEHKDLISQLQQPVSWKLLFGGPPPNDIY